VAEVVHGQAAPVVRGTYRLETAFTVASILVAQYLEPSLSVPAQQVRTEQTLASPVERGDRSTVKDRGPYTGVHWLQGANGNRHRSQNTAPPEDVDGPEDAPLAQ
jgi:hypothetical protein